MHVLTLAKGHIELKLSGVFLWSKNFAEFLFPVHMQWYGPGYFEGFLFLFFKL